MSGIAEHARTVAFALLSGLMRLLGRSDYEQVLESKSTRVQSRIAAATLAGLFASSLVAAQFGWIGMLVFFLAVVLIIN